MKRRRHAIKYRKIRRVCGVNDERTEKAKEYYFKEKEEARNSEFCIACS